MRGLINLKAMLAEHCPQIEIVGEAGTLEDARELIAAKREEISLAFLDINLPDGEVFTLVQGTTDEDDMADFTLAIRGSHHLGTGDFSL